MGQITPDHFNYVPCPRSHIILFYVLMTIIIIILIIINIWVLARLFAG